MTNTKRKRVDLIQKASKINPAYILRRILEAKMRALNHEGIRKRRWQLPH